MLLSIDIYKMVCFPFTYKDFCDNYTIFKYLLKGTIVGLLLCIDEIAMSFVLPAVMYAHHTGMKRFSSAIVVDKAIVIIQMIKTICFKICYSIAIARFAYVTRKGLLTTVESTADNSKRQRRNRRIFYFTLIPLLLNFLFTAHEIMEWDLINRNLSIPDLAAFEK